MVRQVKDIKRLCLKTPLQAYRLEAHKITAAGHEHDLPPRGWSVVNL
jgi:hypothetical protein